ncbi:hypothetical protein AMTRI_Chr04g185530 [Amborella trichopoda]
MRRVKIQVKKIENKTNMQKANDLSVLCDIDIALIIFYIFSQYMNLPVLQDEQREINGVQCQLEEAQRKLKYGDPIEITSPSDAKYHEHILEDTPSQESNGKSLNANGFLPVISIHITDWFSHSETHFPQHNFIDSNAILSLRYFYK